MEKRKKGKKENISGYSKLYQLCRNKRRSLYNAIPVNEKIEKKMIL